MTFFLFLIARAFALDATVEVGEITVATDAQETVAEARAALTAGRFADAAGLYRAIAESGGGAPARVAEAIAYYEVGDLNSAKYAVQLAITATPKDPAALNVLGLVQVDGGDVLKGIETLKAAKAAAHSAGRKASEARAQVNLGLAYLDLGDTRSALAEAESAVALATEAGEPDVAGAAAQVKAAVAAFNGTDSAVGGMLGKGQTKSARKSAEAALSAAKTPRQELQAGLDLAAVERAEGNLDGASSRLATAARKAREGGLVREHAVALVELGLVQSLGGRSGVAEDTLRAAAKSAQAGGYRVVEVDARCELGIVLARKGDLAGAESEQRTAGTLLTKMSYPQGIARQAELGGVIAAARGDLPTAKSALGQAATYYAGKGRNLDAARAQTALVGAWQQVDPATVGGAVKAAEGYFAAAGDPLGAAHVALARALGDGRAKRLPEALTGFAAAADLAEKVGGGRATALAKVAREDAAATLVMLGHDKDLAALASQAGLGELVKREQDLEIASARYDAGLAAYAAAHYDEARATFKQAAAAFDTLGEKEYSLRSRRGAGWAGYNALVSTPVEKALPSWQALVEENAKVEDAELYARTYGAAVMASVSQKVTGLDMRLEECTRVAEKAGLADVGARCHGALAEDESHDLKDRAGHARAAFHLAPEGAAGIYALYAVAVDAYNAGDNALAIELGTLAKPHAGKLGPAIDEVVKAAKGS